MITEIEYLEAVEVVRKYIEQRKEEQIKNFSIIEDKNIRDLDLSVRLFNCCKFSSINTLKEIYSFYLQYLKSGEKLRFGKKSIAEIEQLLKDNYLL